MDHLSISQIAMYARCPRQWAFRYADGLIRPPGIAALVGGGAHGGFAGGMTHKLSTGANAAPNDVADMAVAEFDERYSKKGALWTPAEKSQGVQNVVGASRDRVAALGHFWACTAQQDYQPKHVERWFEIPLPKLGTSLVGRIDLVDEADIVVDWKTGGRRVSTRQAQASPQLTAYALAMEREQPTHQPRATRLDCLREGAETTRTVHAVEQGRLDYRRLLARIQAAHRAIQSGSFPPCDPTEWFCSRKWCGYADICEYYVPELDDDKDKAAES